MNSISTKNEQEKDPIKYFLGIDVHKKQWVVTIRALGMYLQTFSMNPSPKELAAHLRRNYPKGKYYSVYEAGFCGFWIHRELMSLWIESRVTNPADVPTTNKEKMNKRDTVDSKKLARELEKGDLTAIYIPEIDHQQLRSLCRLRHKCSQQIARIKNRIKSYLYYYGIFLSDDQISKSWSAAFISQLEEQCKEETAGSVCLQFLVEELKEQRNRLYRIVRELRKFVRKSGYASTLKYLLTVPGIGFTTAITLITEIIDIHRFKNLDHLCALVGLVPSTDSSGEKDRNTGLTPRKNKYLKHLIIEASWMAIRKDPHLLECYSQLIRRMRKTDAIVRIARKLLNRIRYVWKNQTAYLPLTAN